MAFAGFHIKRILIIRVEHNSGLIQFITKIAEEAKITIATFTAIGALKNAKIAFYDQGKHEYQQMMLDAPYEIASCIGNVSMKNGKPFVHAHVVLADVDGHVKSGHLLEGVVFASEVHLYELKGQKLERSYDEMTGLSLWNIS